MRITEICQSGTTVLFVSHSGSLIERLCQQAIWLVNGKVQMAGEPSEIVKLYETQILRAQQDERRSSEKQYQRSPDPVLNISGTKAEKSKSPDQKPVFPEVVGAKMVETADHVVFNSGLIRLTKIELLNSDLQPCM